MDSSILAATCSPTMPFMNSPPDVENILKLSPAIQRLGDGMPRLNGGWKTLRQGTSALNPQQLTAYTPDSISLAEEQATTLRTITYHIRKQWYKKRCRLDEAVPSPS